MVRLLHDVGKPDFSITPNGASSCVVVFHEVWGLVPHTQDVCKRIGKLGFAAMAPNLYRGHDQTLTSDNIQGAMEGVWELTLEERRNKAKVAQVLAKKGVDQKIREVASVLYDPKFRDSLLKRAVASVEEASSRFERVSTLGFCLGGGLSMKTATKSRRLTSAVAFYGEPPASEDAKRIAVPVLAIYAAKDEIINQKVPGFVGAMLDSGKDLTLKTYPKTMHGFFNNTRKNVYDRPAAHESWELTRWFLERTLG
ncbi:MAG: dienelactone hydrolase family protein [Thaumarchaeota archaeon]|nr:dienelactone hydrolase family protein [Nitrososphaerota archaeon]